MDKLSVLRSIDKLDRIGMDGVRQLLTTGRKDESGDYTLGAGLSEAKADLMLEFLNCSRDSSGNDETLRRMSRWFAIMAMPDAEIDMRQNAKSPPPH